MLHDFPGVYRQALPLAAITANAATGNVLAIPNPMDGAAEFAGFEVVSPTNVVGDSTNRRNFNVKTVAGVELAHLDLTSGTDLDAGVPVAGELNSSLAKSARKVAEGGAVILESELVGSGVGIPAGTVFVAKWKGA